MRSRVAILAALAAEIIAALEPVTRLAECDECEAIFERRSLTHRRFCTNRCRSRASVRAWRASHR